MSLWVTGSRSFSGQDELDFVYRQEPDPQITFGREIRGTSAWSNPAWALRITVLLASAIASAWLRVRFAGRFGRSAALANATVSTSSMHLRVIAVQPCLIEFFGGFAY